MRKRWLACAIVVAIVGLRRHHDLIRSPSASAPIRFATFNIEDFPKDARQVEGAFDEMAPLHAGFIAVQEIGDAELLLATAKRRLGASWEFVDEQAPPRDRHQIGVLFDTARWTLVSSEVHDETRLGARHKPVLEVRLRADSGEIVRVLVVHLKSGTPGRATRSRQHAALARVIERAVRSGDRVVVLGDFNATEDGDRTDLGVLAKRTGLSWATEGLACSAYWSRDDGCPSSRLDHVLVWKLPTRVEVGGACARAGCEWQDRCPIYTEQISDHCPVAITIDQ